MVQVTENESAARPEREAIPTVEVGWTSIAALLAATAALLLLVPMARQTAAGSVLRGSSWWENLNLFGLLLLITVVGIAGFWARMRPRDLGLRRSKLPEGLIATFLAWCVMQAWPYVASGSAQIARTWSDPGALPTLRWLAVMLFATALWEEVAFRGFLLPQLYLKLRGPHWLKVAAALLLSQLAFALAHAPAHIMIRHLFGGELLRMLLLQGFAGILLGLLYLRTRNLWICIGIHALANAPTPLFDGAMGWELPLVALLLAWPLLRWKRENRGLAQITTSVAPFGDAATTRP